jgi:hypothetical protein
MERNRETMYLKLYQLLINRIQKPPHLRHVKVFALKFLVLP